MHLLLVEDNPGDVFLMRVAIATFLEQGTVQFSTVTDGIQAVAFLRHHAPYTEVACPDLVLLDLNLPGKSGYEVLAELQQDAELRSMPVVVLTTSDNPEDISRCYELGANAYVVKPLELGQFLHVGQLMVAFWSACKFRPRKD